MRGRCFLVAFLAGSASLTGLLLLPFAPQAVVWADDEPPAAPAQEPPKPTPTPTPTPAPNPAPTPGLSPGLPRGDDAPSKAEPPKPKALQDWVRDLDSDSFLVRERATESLVKAGASSIAPLVTTLRGSSLEVSTRGVYVLRRLALAGDLATQQAAQEGLAEVAKARATSAARLAGDTLLMLSAIRQDKAIEQLRKLGANITRTHRQIGFQVAEVLAVEIGETWKGKDHDLGRIRWLLDARQITFTGPQVTNDWLSHLAQLEELQSLVLNRTSINHAGMQHLSELRQIQELEIKYTPIGDASVPLLGQFKAAQRIKLYGTGISPAGAAQLKTLLANAEIDHRRGAFLGVGCEQPPLPCSIIQVQPNTAASRAELKEGDVIVEYNGVKVDDFDGLKKLIGGQKGGDSAMISVIRGGVRTSEQLKKDMDRPLGIEGKKHLIGVEVSAVQKDSIAETAGIKKGDVLTQFNDTAVSDPASLQTLLDKQEEQIITVQLLRGAELVSKKVTFGEWE